MTLPSLSRLISLTTFRVRLTGPSSTTGCWFVTTAVSVLAFFLCASDGTMSGLSENKVNFGNTTQEELDYFSTISILLLSSIQNNQFINNNTYFSVNFLLFIKLLNEESKAS